MLFNKINSKLFITCYDILIEILIGFSTFAIFFYVFMTYYFTSYEIHLMAGFINKSISFYSITQSAEQKKQLQDLIQNSNEKKKIESEVKQNEDAVQKHNKVYDNKLLMIVIIMISILFLLVIVPLLLGFVRLDQLNFKYIGLSLVLHIILIVGFELLFLLVILKYINPVKLYMTFQENKNNTGSYI